MSDEHPSPPPPPPPPSFSPYAPPEPGPEPARRSRLAVVLAVVVAVVLVGASVALLPLLGDDDVDAVDTSAEAGEETGEEAGDEADEEAGEPDLSEVVTFTTLRSDHVTESVDDYESSPPAGGKHFPVWLDCGVYDEPVRDEFTVHNLEHGTFWFTYDAAALDDDEVAALAAQLPDNGIMTPYDGLAAPVVVTVWEAQLALTGVDDPRLALFLEEYAGGVTAPEPFASCAGGATLDDIAELALPSDVAAG